MATQNIGKVIQIAGPAVDVEFSDGNLPPIYQALRVTSEGFKVPEPIDVVLEVQQHLGEGRVRTVAMQATDGMVRGMNALDLGGPISVPVGKETLGRVITLSASQWTSLARLRRPSACPSIVWPRRSMSKQLKRKCSRQA